MSEGSRAEQLMKRASEEDSAERLLPVKRLKKEEGPGEDDKKCPKKKVVLLMAYSGKGYYGMQVHTAAGIALSSDASSSSISLNFNVWCVSEKSSSL